MTNICFCGKFVKNDTKICVKCATKMLDTLTEVHGNKVIAPSILSVIDVMNECAVKYPKYNQSDVYRYFFITRNVKPNDLWAFIYIWLIVNSFDIKKEIITYLINNNTNKFIKNIKKSINTKE